MPVIAAILAAREIEGDTAVRMLSAIQYAHYGEGRRVVDNAVLADVAASIGLATDTFARTRTAAPIDEHIAASR